MSRATPGAAALRNLREGAVIVFSVLLALAADSWREGLGDRAREAAYLEQLATELDSLGTAIDSAVRDDSTHLARTEALLKVLHGDGPRAAALDSIAARVPLSYSIFRPPTGTLRVLTTSDQSSLIRSDETRAAMQAVEGALNRTEVLLNRTETEVWMLGQRFFAAVEALWDSNGRRPPGGPLLITDNDFDLLLPLSLQRSSPELRAIYGHMELVLRNRLGYLKDLKVRSERLNDLLQADGDGS